MFKRILIILAVLLITGGLFTRDAVAGPPWPADVFFEEDICVTQWVDKDYNVVDIYGDGIWKVHEFNNSVTLSCHDKIDFDEYATIEEVCTFVPDLCHGNGSISWQGWDCWIYYDYITNDSHFVMNPSGNWTLTCHFNENDLP